MKLVAGASYGHDMAWNPWSALKAQPEIELVWDPIAERAGGGAYYRASDGTAVILLDKRMHRRDRNAVLAHELAHHELAGGREIWVEKKVACRLVPHDELVAFIVRKCNIGEAVGAADVAEEFDVPEPVAERALLLLKQAWSP